MCVCVFLSGLLIEMWKVTKVVEIRVDRRNLIGGVLPRISFIDRPSYQSTKKYDMVGCVCVCVDTYTEIKRDTRGRVAPEGEWFISHTYRIWA